MLNSNKVFRQYALDFFGTGVDSYLTDEMIEESRIYACKEETEDDAIKEVFLNHIFGTYI